jgi:hypothetical protein
MKPSTGIFSKSFCIIGILFICATAFIYGAEKPKYTVEEIMKAIFKGEDSTNKKVVQGKAAPADYDKLVEYLSALPLNDPPQGDATVWGQKTATLLNAAIALKEKKPDALSQYNKAVNCQACHRTYRPE